MLVKKDILRVSRRIIDSRFMGSVKVSKTGLQFDKEKGKSASPAPGQVTVTTLASQITHEDLRAIKGISFANKLQSVAGTTAFGKIESFAQDVKGISNGDSVLVVAEGTWTDSVTVPQSSVFKVAAKGMLPEDGALIPSYAAAWGILNKYATLKAGDVVLVMGSDPIASAVAEVGKALGSTVIQSKPSEVNSKELSAKVKGEAKLCVASLGGMGSADAMKHLVKSGTIVLYNGSISPAVEGEVVNVSLTSSIFENKSVCGFDFTTWSKTDPENCQKAIDFAAGLLKGQKAAQYKYADFASAIKSFEEKGTLAVLTH